MNVITRFAYILPQIRCNRSGEIKIELVSSSSLNRTHGSLAAPRWALRLTSQQSNSTSTYSFSSIYLFIELSLFRCNAQAQQQFKSNRIGSWEESKCLIESDVDLMLISKHTISEINTQFVVGQKMMEKHSLCRMSIERGRLRIRSRCELGQFHKHKHFAFS